MDQALGGGTVGFYKIPPDTMGAVGPDSVNKAFVTVNNNYHLQNANWPTQQLTLVSIAAFCSEINRCEEPVRPALGVQSVQQPVVARSRNQNLLGHDINPNRHFSQEQSVGFVHAPRESGPH